MYRHFVFDIDGTLIDTERTGVLSLIKTVRELLGVEMPYEEAYGYFGIPSAKVAPLLGLLGTVLGMQETFSAMRNSTSLNELSGGISSALITTAAGLVLAIPCLIAYNYMVARVETFCIEMEKASSEIIYFFDNFFFTLIQFPTTSPINLFILPLSHLLFQLLPQSGLSTGPFS